MCLDWRQICDGMRDCTNGRDEENCFEMELNECDSQTEYRCRNGMCVPKSFSFDLTMDCMDFYDEQEFRDASANCFTDASVDCEEHTCGLAKFSCGDGSCLDRRWPETAFGSPPYMITGNDGVTVATLLALAVQNLFSHCTLDVKTLLKQLFGCRNNLFISYHRRFDKHIDCIPWYPGTSESDEYHWNTCYSNQTNRFICKRNDERRCINRRSLHDGVNDCFGYEDESFPIGCTDEFDCQYFREFNFENGLPIIFQELCNGYFGLSWQDEIENDETNCDDWPCTARNIHCDNVWNRRNGCDELDCPQTIPDFIARHVANCSTSEHYCLHYNSTQITCLPLAKAGDRIVDCLFASDERVFHPSMCRNTSTPFPIFIHPSSMCSDDFICPLADDALLCPWRALSSCPNDDFTCKNGTCLSRKRRCDGHIDCSDAEDEWACELKNLLQTNP
ncbi:unnamed protein product [Rotaria sp. Silwood1]|nr:unnamed protein product [Rotaria sp. Silwood1]